MTKKKTMRAGVQKRTRRDSPTAAANKPKRKGGQARACAECAGLKRRVTGLEGRLLELAYEVADLIEDRDRIFGAD
jgi:hypothetical protein